MKTKSIYILLFLCCASICFAQDKLFEQYADMDDVTSVYISKKMFDLMPDIETGRLDLKDLRGKIDNLQILTTDREDLCAKMRKDFKNLVTQSHEELMRIKDGKDKVTFYVQQENELIREMLMLADSDDEFVIIRLKGKFTLEDIQKIAKQVQ